MMYKILTAQISKEIYFLMEKDKKNATKELETQMTYYTETKMY